MASSGCPFLCCWGTLKGEPFPGKLAGKRVHRGVSCDQFKVGPGGRTLYAIMEQEGHMAYCLTALFGYV